ncbi:MAG: bifunctional PIG-L family deacetylase/class I SAM-dependent methyltransferase [Microcella sp.]|uniref:bifunctional PIG-L family deacetylase/class I SAM-dependent methyltransferase n=1 Tax=Microcella sp. TaxID=1913979 RepID=UPI0024C7AF8C|nr:bifunctional PIG-L family deacetylase/class I SAM-dependent methyltransferase [Microcella sp.]UYN83149.1 MAG: bifunctional PIG-L family deacetylase/class I SAM-dependent methyltransferase [Microcella sp.]
MVTFDSRVAGTDPEAWRRDARLRSAPRFTLDDLVELVVVAAHPDDETLGAGGLMAEASRRGVPIKVIVVTDGAGSHPGNPAIADERSRELASAVTRVAPDASLLQLRLADGRTLEQRETVRSLLEPLIESASPAAHIVAPWRGDGHRDHRVVGEVVAELTGSRVLLEYPVWMWHWAEPGSADVPWGRMVAVEIDRALKQRALRDFPSQMGGDAPVLRPDMLANFDRGTEYFFVTTNSMPSDYFDDVYARHRDPWGFESRWYESRKLSITVASLPDERYERALEIGCSIGVLTEALAARCDEVLAIDIAQAAVDRARRRLGRRARVERVDALRDFPEGPFDLIVLSETGYYFDARGLDALLDEIENAMTASGTLLVCHWRHPVGDYPLTGAQVHRRVVARGLPLIAHHSEADFILAVFSRDGRSVARRTGLI